MSKLTPFMLLASAALITGCGQSGDEAGTAPQLLTIDGSSTVFPISEAMAEEYQLKTKTRVTVGASGTGGGFKKFCAGEIDITGASRNVKPTESEMCAANGVEMIELPVAFDGISVVIHPSNTWAKTLTVDQLNEPPEGQLNKVMETRAKEEEEARGYALQFAQVRPHYRLTASTRSGCLHKPTQNNP